MRNSNDLRPFAARVRLVRAWRGLGIGGLVGALGGLLLGALDWFRVLYATWPELATVFLSCACLGSIVGAALRLPPEALAASVDRRGGMKDRLRTTMERDGSGGLDAALAADAAAHLENLKPKAMYPIRPGRWHLAMVIAAVFASMVFLLGNSPLMLTEQQKKEREEVKAAGKTVERVRKDFQQDIKQAPTEAEKELAEELKRFQKELERGRMDKQESMQKANDLAKKADELTREQAKTVDQELAKASAAQERMEKSARETQESKDLEKGLAEAQAKGQDLQKQIKDLKQNLESKNLSKEDRQQLEAKQKQLSKDLKANQDLRMELSQKIKDMLDRMHSDPLYKEIRDLAEKLAKNAQQTQKTGQPKLTKEQLEEMKKELEALAEKLKDDKAMKEYLKALKKALEEALKNGATACLKPGLMACLGMRMPSVGPGAPSEDVWMGDTGHVNKLDKPVASQGKTQPVGVTGDRQDKGEETYIEVRGPASLGKRSGVPYQQVLPSYRRKAEQAINRQKIPPDQQKRVKEYFNALRN